MQYKLTANNQYLCNIIHSKSTDTADVKQLTTQLNDANQQIDTLLCDIESELAQKDNFQATEISKAMGKVNHTPSK